MDWLGGGAFLLKSASEMASSGSTSSLRMVKRGLSHRFLESGASNRKTNASKLRKIKCTVPQISLNLNSRREGISEVKVRLLTHMSWVYCSAASLLMFHDELCSSDVKQYTFIERKHTHLSRANTFFADIKVNADRNSKCLPCSVVSVHV